MEEYGLGSEISTYGDAYSYGILLLEMITGKRPIENMFEEGHNLHNFARTTLPDRVMEIADPVLLDNEEKETRATTIQVNNRCKIVECSISMVNIGVACSTESPQGSFLYETRENSNPLPEKIQNLDKLNCVKTMNCKSAQRKFIRPEKIPLRHEDE
ncbi:receptor kinase-like protein Xa21 [Camellia sinensis]|uniref:receptor kinase-like protein Xa21 n=1 Tax=Camellia sinensis TaxID=4442 RepID=UPI001035FE3C|nr:receptor kinase-like protein Xa21 [Camellia sinensis]